MSVFILQTVSLVLLSNNTRIAIFLLYFFFNSTATTEIYTLSLHDALPISPGTGKTLLAVEAAAAARGADRVELVRSEEHTSELQSLTNLVCRLLLEKKNILKSPYLP